MGKAGASRGRPRHPSYRLHGLVIRAGVAALAQRTEKSSADEMSPVEAYDAGLRMAANVAARLAFAKALRKPLGEDPTGFAQAAVTEACGMFEISPQA
jgi:hypothetical protein